MRALRDVLLAIGVAVSLWAAGAQAKPDREKLDRPRSGLDKLDPNELTPAERMELPKDSVAILRGAAGHFLSAQFTPDDRLALGNQNGTVELWSLNASEPKRQSILKADKETGPVYRLAVSPKGTWLATVHGMPGKTLRLWRLTKDGAVHFASHNLPRIDDVAFHPDDKTLAFGSNAGQLFEITDTALRPLDKSFAGANSNFRFLDDGRTFASIFFTPERNGNKYGSEVMFWTLDKEQVRQQVRITQDDSIKSIALSPNRRMLATGSIDKQVRLWDLTGRPPNVRSSFAVPAWPKSLHFTPDSAYLVAFTSGADIVLWNVAAAKPEKTWNFEAKRNSPFATGAMYRLFSATAMSPDGRHILFSNYTANAVIIRLPIELK
jgi:WD40 repeat protein